MWPIRPWVKPEPTAMKEACTILLKTKLASPKSTPISCPTRWPKNIFRGDDWLKREYSTFFVSKAFGHKRGTLPFSNQSYFRKITSGYFIGYEIAFHEGEVDFISKSEEEVIFDKQSFFPVLRTRCSCTRCSHCQIYRAVGTTRVGTKITHKALHVP